MKTSKAYLIYYSPTGTGKKVIESVGKGLGYKSVEEINLTDAEAAAKTYKIPADALAVFATPVYGGRVPVVAVQRFSVVKGDGNPAVLLAVYGNRAFEDALIELHDITSANGFKTIAAAAFIGEHSFSAEKTPIAVGRPDAEDLKKSREFGEKVKAKLDAKADEIKVPGNKPYRERGPAAQRAPEIDSPKCTLCGACADACPTNAITVSDEFKLKKEACTACSACVKTCPQGALYWTNEGILKAAAWLAKDYAKRREPEIFI